MTSAGEPALQGLAGLSPYQGGFPMKMYAPPGVTHIWVDGHCISTNGTDGVEVREELAKALAKTGFTEEPHPASGQEVPGLPRTAPPPDDAPPSSPPPSAPAAPQTARQALSEDLSDAGAGDSAPRPGRGRR